MNDLKYLKLHYGEDFAHLCRSLFPTILKEEGRLAGIIESKFAHSKFLAKDLKGKEKSFKDFVYDIYEKDYKKIKFKLLNNKTPEELMDEAGYILYPECKTEADIQKFRKYWYRPDERVIEYDGKTPEKTMGDELCTFDGGRLSNCRVWFAIKKDIDNIKRENYAVEKENPYDVSALSIQVDKFGRPNISIKGRYNHSVCHPDVTFGNNLDNIIPGLSESFGITNDIPKTKLILDKYILADDGRYYRVFGCSFSTYFCENGYVVEDGHIFRFDPDRFLVTNEGYIFDSKTKQVQLYTTSYINEFGSREIILESDEFAKTYNNAKKIEFERNRKDERRIIITQEEGSPVVIELTDQNGIKSIDDPNTTILKEGFLNHAPSLEKIKMENLRAMDSNCFEVAPLIQEAYFPNLLQIMDNCFIWVQKLKYFEANKLRTMGDYNFVWLKDLRKFEAKNLKTMGSYCFSSLNNSKQLNAPKLRKEGRNCFIGYDRSRRLGEENPNEDNLDDDELIDDYFEM